MQKILLCLDTDAQPSVFDAVVAIDAGADQLLRHGGVAPDSVRNIVYGAMFTRGPADLKNTAIFIGGTDVAAGEKLLAKTTECFFGPMRVSVMLDSNGANTTAAAAVLTAKKHVDLRNKPVTVLAATGSVGRRVVRLLAREQALVTIVSRQLDRANQVHDEVLKLVPDAELNTAAVKDHDFPAYLVENSKVIISAGAPGVELLPLELRKTSKQLKVAIDLNAVPPAGIAGILPADKAAEREGQICYGAIGVGGLKMKLHKACIRRLFETNDAVLDAEQIYELGGQL